MLSRRVQLIVASSFAFFAEKEEEKEEEERGEEEDFRYFCAAMRLPCAAVIASFYVITCLITSN